MKVQVYLNEGEDNFLGFHNKFANTPVLHRVAEFHMDDKLTQPAGPGASPDALHIVWEQLNVGGDIVPAEPWTVQYRRDGNRSLSVGDVVVLGEIAYAVATFGWDRITTDELRAALAPE
jgi:hypothetical protein